ncbi:hypothetical protein DMB90_02415 [Raoultella planticola]|uniref:Nudix hydrolase domain-containing protein n=1 Tax=Raoultella planticola TaxID=575 RepID=A0A5P6A946_RAOPL|nr:hypothetical protein DMB90_02415 [Raoultella planticola]
MLIETCAGLLDNDEPEACIRKEAIEETGYEVGDAHKLFELYMSPGGVTEIVHFFIAEYSDAQRKRAAAALKMKISRYWSCLFAALQMVADGAIRDGKAVILLQYLQTSGLMAGLSDKSD